MIQSSLHASKAICFIVILAQLLVAIHCGLVTKRNSPAMSKIELFRSDLKDSTKSVNETKALRINDKAFSSETIEYGDGAQTVVDTTTHLPFTINSNASKLSSIITKIQKKMLINAQNNENEETMSTTIWSIPEENTMFGSEEDETTDVEVTSPQSITTQSENITQQIIENIFKEVKSNNASSTKLNESIAVTQKSQLLNLIEPNTSKDEHQTITGDKSKQTPELSNNNNSYPKSIVKRNFTDTINTKLRHLSKPTNYDQIERSESIHNASTSHRNYVDPLTLTSQSYTDQNVLQEVNEIISTTKPASEKKAKFFHDNSTNANKLNLPDASEVWTLVGMKAVPSKSPTIQSLATTSEMPGNPKNFNMDSANNSIINSKEKNLLDWKQIMINGGFDDKTESNFIDNNQITNKIKKGVEQSIRQKPDDLQITVVNNYNLPTTVSSKISEVKFIPTQITPTSSAGEKLDDESNLVTSATQHNELPIHVNITEETEALAKAKTAAITTKSLYSSGLSPTSERETNLVIEEKKSIGKSTAGENIRPSDNQLLPTTQLSLEHTTTTQNSLKNELIVITSTTLAGLVDADADLQLTISSAPDTTLLTSTEEATTTDTPIHFHNVSVWQPLPESNTSTFLQSSQLPTQPSLPATERNNSSNETTLKTMNNNYGSDYSEQTNVNANVNDVGEEATVDLRSPSIETTTFSQVEASSISTIASDNELGKITSAGVTNFIENITTAITATTPTPTTTTTIQQITLTPAAATALPRNLENLTQPNTFSVIAKKVHEISTLLDTSERIPTSSSPTQTHLTSEISTAKAVLKATTIQSSTEPSSSEVKEAVKGTLITVPGEVTTVGQILQETTTEPTSSDFATETETATEPETTTATIISVFQSTTDFEDNAVLSTAKTTEETSTTTSNDMNFIDNPLYRTTTPASNELTDEVEDVKSLLPVSTTMETHAATTHQPTEAATVAVAISTTNSSNDLEDSFNTTTTPSTATITTTTTLMSSHFTDSTLDLVPTITGESTSQSSSSTFEEETTTMPTTTMTPTTTMAPTTTTISSPILPITLETRTTYELGVAKGDPLLHHRDSMDMPSPEMDVNVIIAISVSVIGIIALILLVGFLYVIRKRQKQLSYVHRCRPVSLDAYSLDNVSVYNSVRRKNAIRSSKRSYGNMAFDDPALRHNNLNATELAKFIERKSAIFEEFKNVPQIIARPDEVPAGCEDKNRYANVIPIPETRVSLQQQNNDEKTEYINANYVRGPKDSPNYYIACQAPLESTVIDFWRMIWEQNSRVIIQATDLVENGIEKCAEYLPPSVTLDNHITFGDFQITLKNREVKDKYAISTIILKHSGENCSRELTHYWYRWPEAGVPNEEAPIIAMLLEARSSLKFYAIELANEIREKSATMKLTDEKSLPDIDAENKKNESDTFHGNGETNLNLSIDKLKTTTNAQGPLTVHCSPGTGRTGTIISCDIAIRSLETPKRCVDIPQIVYYVRKGRASAVQTKEQYEFIYKIANMYATKITNVATDN